MKKVLIIGANSYIGREFDKYSKESLNKTLEIKLVSASDGEWKTIDFNGYDTVLHLSALVHKKEKMNMADMYDRINYKLPVDIALKAKEKRVRHFIFMSTAAVYNNKMVCITKDTIPEPTTLYGKSKLKAENSILELADNNFIVTIIRSPMVYGENCEGNYKKLKELSYYIPIIPAYTNKRSVLCINKLNEVMKDIITYETEGYIYPQDDKYADTCELIINFRKEAGKKTYKCSLLNPLVSLLKKSSKTINKMFGDFYFKV